MNADTSNVQVLRRQIDAHDIRRMAAKWSGRMAQVQDHDDLLGTSGMSGDVAFGFFKDFAATYDVNMDGYLWYFHSSEEGMNIGAYFFDPPNKYVRRLPVSLDQLASFASRGQWVYAYPAHDIPPIRKDKILNRVLLIIGGLALFRYFMLAIW